LAVSIAYVTRSYSDIQRAKFTEAGFLLRRSRCSQKGDDWGWYGGQTGECRRPIPYERIPEGEEVLPEEY